MAAGLIPDRLAFGLHCIQPLRIPMGALERVPLVVERREVGVSVVRLGSVGG